MKASNRLYQNLERQMFDLVNQERVRRGLTAYIFSEKLAYVSYLHSIEQQQMERIYHQSAQTGSAGDRLKNHQIIFKSCGENVATSGSVATSHDGLMKSPGHKANILHKSFTHIGIGVSMNSWGQIYFTQVFMEEIPKVSTETAINLLQDINELRSKRYKSVIKEIPLDALKTAANQLKQIPNAEHITFDSQAIIKSCTNELKTKRIPYRSLSLLCEIRYDNQLLDDHKEHFLKSNLKSISYCVEQHPINQSILVIMLFYLG